MPDSETSSKPPDARRALIRNERAKLSATYVNGLAIATFAVGGLAPLIALLSAGTPASAGAGLIYGLAGFCWIISGALHLLARGILRELTP
ncbi:amino acid transporter [Methylorubrum sp. SB2]|uniref:amino acid transporter n=1 Tax=Methylorubrum subtropicum TaxID=3138812 RepID=UPI00313D5BC9